MPLYEVTLEVTRRVTWRITAPDLRSAQEDAAVLSDGDADDVQVRSNGMRVRELPEIDERVR